MKPLVNLEEKIGKTVGRFPETAVEAYEKLLRTSRGLRPPLPFPKGVFRFKTHEEANAWEWKYIMEGARKLQASRRSNT